MTYFTIATKLEKIYTQLFIETYIFLGNNMPEHNMPDHN